MTPQDKFAAMRRDLNAGLIERSEEIDLSLTALVAREHCLFVGPPGTAKSMLSDSIVRWIGGERFQILLTKFTTPEEVFGPISLKGLKNDSYYRIIDGKLPTAHVAFVDEIFKASSAILNTMLTVLNERKYYNNGVALVCPLQLCIAASNEWPGQNGDGKELGALFDRFAIPAGKTDMILITDAIGNVADDTVSEFNYWKQTKEVKLLTLLVGRTDAGDLYKVADRVWDANCLDIESEGVSELLSL